MQLQLIDHDVACRAKPFLKWAGGKKRLLKVLTACLPEYTGTYFEPFVGGGALFFSHTPKKAVLNDLNAELVHCYRIVQKRPEQLISALRNMMIGEEEFYRVRSTDPETLNDVDRAARLIYLNKTCYNGLYRVNQQGQFNTPFGKYSKVQLCDPDNLYAASDLLESASLTSVDYEIALGKARRNDFVYLDPPYVPVGKYADFKRYTAVPFDERELDRLVTVMSDLDSRGCFVLLSNSYHPAVESLFSKFNQATVEMPRYVNCKGEGRGLVKELLVSNYQVRGLSAVS